MKGYLYILLVTSVCGSICTVFVQGGYEKYIKYVASLVCVAIMIMPFRNGDFFELLEYDYKNDFEITDINQYENTLNLTEEKAEDYISQVVFAEWGIKPSYTDIKIDWDSQPPVILGITVAVFKKDEMYLAEIKDYLSKTFGQGVEVIAV